MGMWRVILLSAFLMMVGGCAVKDSPVEVASRRGDALIGTDTDRLVCAFGHNRSFWGVQDKHLRAELERRAIFTPEQWAMIDNKQIAIGEPEWLVWCSWGAPDDVDEFTSGSGTTRTLWYKRGYTDPTYQLVSIRLGRVEAFGR
jgi:hypothetical protein